MRPHTLATHALLGKPGKPGKPPGNGNNADKADKTADKAPTPADTDTTPTDDGGLLGSLTNVIWDHKWLIPVLALAALIGINYLWKQFRNKQSMRGVAVRPLGPIFKDVITFARKEDARPLHAKLPPAITANRVYLVLTILTLIGIFPGIPGIPAGPLLPLFLLLITIAPRYSKIARARRATLTQMFAVATSECRYPKGSELAPWNYVQIANWTNLVQPGNTTINIPAAYQSEDVKTREKFERNFNGTVSEENAWTYKWESAKNRLVCEPAAHLPGMAAYPGPGAKWDEIPVGVKGDGTQAIIPLSVTPHSLVCGPTGSGKSVLQRSVLFHILAHSDTWRLVAIDMKRVEMAWLRKYPQVLKVATDLEEAVEVLRSLKAEMMRRYEEMEEAGVNHAKDLPNPPKAIFCMIDESTVLLAPEGIKTDEGKERDELHGEAGAIMGELGRLSRASMIHVMACFQRPDATFLKGETKANFDCRIAAGRMDTTPSLMVLDSEAANRLPKIKGRGMIRIGGELDTFQGYFAEQSWFDEWVAAQEAAKNGAPVGGESSDGPPVDEFAEESDASEAQAAPDAPAAPEAPSGGRARGLRGLAAKAAAKAQERAARMDAEQGAESEAWVDDSAEAFSPEPTTDVAPPLPQSPPPVAQAATPPVPPVVAETEAEDDGFDLGFDFDALLVDVDDLEDEGEDEDEEAAYDEVPTAYESAAPVVRPVLPQSVPGQVPMYQPGAPLPGQTGPVTSRPAHPSPVSAPVAPVSPTGAPSQPVRPAGGLPVQPPPGLPVRPPQPRQP